MANIESRIAWSEKANSSVHSPVSNHENLDNTKLDNLIDNINNLEDKDLMEAVKETFNKDIGLKLEVSNVNL